MFPTKQIDHLSYSQINMYSTCPLAWWIEYVLEIPSSKSVYMLLGSAIHTAISDYFQDKLLGIRPMSTNELITHASETIKTILSESDYELPKKGQSLEDIVDSRLQGLREYMDNIGQHLSVKFTEKKLKRVIPGTSVDFIGVLDLITSERTVVDFKVVGSAYSPAKASASLQPHAYGFLLGRPVNFEIHCSAQRLRVRCCPFTCLSRT
jgi:hypothetical protein